MAKAKISLVSIFLTVCISLQIAQTNGANILGLFTSHSQSHLIVHMSLVKVLAERGHNVTVVVSQKPKVAHKDINVIIIPPSVEQEHELNQEVASMTTKKHNVFTLILNFFGSLRVMVDMQADVLKDPRFTALYDNPETNFDLVICGFFMNTYQLGVAAKFKAPLIISWMAPPMVIVDRLIGNPSETSYVPNVNMAIKVGEKMTFLQRLQNLIMNNLFDAFMRIMDIRMRNFYKELFPSDGSFPTLEDMYRNISLVFCNSHFSEGPVRPYVPGLVEIGGIQVKVKPDPLPEDIAKFLDSAKDSGAILFSLGSNLKGSSIKPETGIYIYNVLSKLKQKVIWKWEDLENTPGKSSNILYKNWMPQDDILAHPNIKLFITHAGKGGVAEAQYHGVPMLALPVFGDQNGNAEKVVASGYGQQLQLLSVTEENFKAALLEVLNNPIYGHNVKKFSKLYRDRPLSAQENVAFWTEYILRHHGAPHMQSPLVHMSFIESSNLDVFVLLFVVIYILYRIFRLGCKFICRKMCKKFVIFKGKSKKGKEQ